jgi:ATP-dependent protease ClpP protease subunit/uncharacterized small protein (DUF1192 family)
MNINQIDLSTLIGRPNGMTYDLYLTNDEIEFGDTGYNNFITLCSQLTEQDIVNLHISTAGGAVSTGALIANAIENSRATFIAHLNSYVWSMGVTIALACDAFVIGDLVEFGIHSVQGGTGYGNVDNIEARSKAVVELNKRLMEKYYSLILNSDEVDLVNRGAEITWFKEELMQRLQKFAENKQQKLLDSLEQEPDLSQFSVEELEEELVAIADDVKKIKSEIKKRKV